MAEAIVHRNTHPGYDYDASLLLPGANRHLRDFNRAVVAGLPEALDHQPMPVGITDTNVINALNLIYQPFVNEFAAGQV